MDARLGNVEEISNSEMYTRLSEFPEQISSALRLKIGAVPKKDKICICAVGASAMAGEIMSDFADVSSDVPITVVRGSELPLWVDRDTAVIAMTYSGNTPETLCLYDVAIKRGCEIICITSGGALAEKCIADRNILIKLPTGMQPRSALGYMLGSLAVLFQEMKVCNSRTDAESLMPSLKKFRDLLLVVDPDNPALELAKGLEGKIPVIYSMVNMRSSAIRWKMQLNENSKTIAFCGTIPEFNHNEIVGWIEDSAVSNFIPVILYDQNTLDVLKCMADTLLEMLRSKKLEVLVFPVNGRNDLEKNLIAIMMGDFVSLYLAVIKGRDPSSAAPMIKDDTREFN